MSLRNSFRKFSKVFLIGFFAILFAAGAFSVPVFASRSSRAEEEAQNALRNLNIQMGYFSAEYTLRADDRGNTYVDVVEKIQANFIKPGINHGIERAIPVKFDGRKVLDSDVEAFIDGKSTKSEFNRAENGNYVFRIGDPSEYVQGNHEYILKYKFYNVIRSADGMQSFYWNTNGAGWLQSFDGVSATVKLDDSVKGKFNGEKACYFGVAGASEKCDFSDVNSEQSKFFFSKFNVKSGQNLTFAIGFKENSFAQPDLSFSQKLAFFLSVAVAILPVLAIIFLVIIFKERRRISKANEFSKSVVPQYLPPKDIDILSAGTLLNSSTKSRITSAVLEFAVNGNIQIIEAEKTNFFGSKNKIYKLKLLNSNNLSVGERGLLSAMFRGRPELDLSDQPDSSHASSIYKALTGETADLKKLFSKEKNKFAHLSIISLAIGFIGFVISGSFLKIDDMLPVVFAAVSALCFAISVIAIGVGYSKIKSKEGNEALNYLEGLKMYISVAEKDRLAALQSLEGSERFAQEFGGSKIKLFEKMLPWAALFGLEDTWAKVIELELSDSEYSPSWYSGAAGFKLGMLAGSISSVSSSLNSYSAPVSSSGSGTGGGFSGGGGGGGGGGGW